MHVARFRYFLDGIARTFRAVCSTTLVVVRAAGRRALHAGGGHVCLKPVYMPPVCLLADFATTEQSLVIFCVRNTAFTDVSPGGIGQLLQHDVKTH